MTLWLLLSTLIGLLMVPTIPFGPETAGRKLEEITARVHDPPRRGARLLAKVTA